MRACDVDFQVVSSVVYQQISQSLDDIFLINSSTTRINKTIISPYSSPKSQTLSSSVIKSPMNTSLTSIYQYTAMCSNGLFGVAAESEDFVIWDVEERRTIFVT
ncbi:unnamed protein product [Rotaria sp. Silwood2]|nr:unnamed protein product [Rotaria sp. Silwood2]